MCWWNIWYIECWYGRGIRCCHSNTLEDVWRPHWWRRHWWRATIWRRKLVNRHCWFVRNSGEKWFWKCAEYEIYCNIKIRKIVHRLWRMYHYNSLHPAGRQSRRIQTCHMQQVTIRSNLTSWWKILKENRWTNRHWTYFYTLSMAVIVAETPRYALQHNDESLATSFNIVLLKRLILSTYSKFYQIGKYWFYQFYPLIGNC